LKNINTFNKIYSGDQMNEKQSIISITPYDIFGHLIPAITFVAGILVLFPVTKILDFLLLINFIKTESNKTAIIQFDMHISVILLLLAIGLPVLYSIGHLIASISSLIFDRNLICRCIGYPYERLLGFDRNFRYRKINNDRAIAKTIGFVIIGIYIKLIFNKFYFINNPNQFGIYILIVIGIFVFIFMILDNIFPGFLHQHPHQQRIQNFYRLPAIIFDKIFYILFSIFKLRSRLEPTVIIRVKEFFEQDFGKPIERSGTGAFWLPYLKLIKNESQISNLLKNHVHSYGFARNLSTCFLFLSILPFFIKNGAISQNFSRNYSLTCSLLMLAFFLRYYYIYYGYFSKLVYRSYILPEYIMSKSNAD
jgi:hypothetical protein